MKKKEKAIVFSLAFLVIGLVAFSGCWNRQQPSPNDTLKIGVVVPLTGNAGVLGDYTLKGLQLAVDDQNAKGGLLGKKIELDVQDSKADPKEGVAIIKNMLAKDQKPFLVYSIMSGVTMAIKPETEKNNILLMSAVGTDRFLENSRYTIRNYVSATTIGQNLAPYLKDTLKVKNLAVFYSNNEYGQSVKDAVRKFCEEKGIAVSTDPYEETSLDYKSLIAAKVNKGTECVYVAGVGKGLGTMIKQIRESGYTGKMVGDQLITFPDVVSVAGDALKGMPYLDFAFDVNSSSASTKSFVDSFKNQFHTDPQNFSVITFDGAKLLFNAVERNKTTDSTKLVEALNGTREYSGVFGPVSVTDRNINFTFHFKQWH
jgi:branched-chain amino acid transport system substrate-binding protein